MFFAAGVGAYQAAMFHLFTHAFFKALLFLGAGSVIHGHGPRAGHAPLRRLLKYLPVTFAVMTIGTIAITGLGIPGVEPGLRRLHSKDRHHTTPPSRRPRAANRVVGWWPSSSASWWPG
jgi:NADH-quinone oxidoreductase subunit L